MPWMTWPVLSGKLPAYAISTLYTYGCRAQKTKRKYFFISKFKGHNSVKNHQTKFKRPTYSWLSIWAECAQIVANIMREKLMMTEWYNKVILPVYAPTHFMAGSIIFLDQDKMEFVITQLELQVHILNILTTKWSI